MEPSFLSTEWLAVRKLFSPMEIPPVVGALMPLCRDNLIQRVFPARVSSELTSTAVRRALSASARPKQQTWSWRPFRDESSASASSNKPRSRGEHHRCLKLRFSRIPFPNLFLLLFVPFVLFVAYCPSLCPLRLCDNVFTFTPHSLPRSSPYSGCPLSFSVPQKKPATVPDIPVRAPRP